MKVIIFLKIALIGASFAMRNNVWPLAEPETSNTPSKYEKRKDRHNYGYVYTQMFIYDAKIEENAKGELRTDWYLQNIKRIKTKNHIVGT